MRFRDVINVADPAQPFRDEILSGSDDIITRYFNRGDLSAAADYQREMITALESICPDGLAKDWRKAVRSQSKNPQGATQWKARALNLDPADAHMSIALASFAPMKVEGQWFLAVPMPIPCPLGPKFHEPAEIVLIHSETGLARLYGDDAPTLIEPIYSERMTAHADARVWAREIATYAVEWFYRRISSVRDANVAPYWTGHAPSALAIGDIRKIAWPHIKSITAGAGIEAAALKKAIFRQAHITHVESPLGVARAA